MKKTSSKPKQLIPFLWFKDDAIQAAKFYTSVFKKSKIKEISDFSGTPSGDIKIVSLELNGQELNIMSAPSSFKLDESFSIAVNCKTQEEVDYYWKKLVAGGGEESMCGWLKDKYGLSWQIVPEYLMKKLKDKNQKKRMNVMNAMLKMKKIIIKDLKKAYKAK